MLVSIFKSVFETNTPYHKDILYVLDRIKKGNSKDKVKSIREGTGNKKTLPGVCFNGTFKKRDAASIIDYSGLIILDFDKFNSQNDAVEFKNNLREDSYVFSCWISPSGKGVKVLVKISSNDISGHFNALKNHFNSNNFDDSGKDVCRFCFESYDPELHINLNSDTFNILENDDLPISENNTVLPIVSDSLIIERLQKWFSKYSMTDGQRNTNIVKFAHALRDFGVDKVAALNHLNQYASETFDIKEITNIIEFAYKQSHKFKSKFFEDTQKKSEIKKQFSNGSTKTDIANNLDLPLSTVKAVAAEFINNITDFHSVNDKGKIQIDPYNFQIFLKQNNITRLYPNKESSSVLVKTSGAIIEDILTEQIKDFVLKYLLEKNEVKVFNYMALNTGLFNFSFLNMLNPIECNLKRDTNDSAFLYYQNCALKISKNSIEQIDYLDVDGHVWRNQIINRDYKKVIGTSVFSKFINFISGGNDTDRNSSFKSVIGYLLHSYKTSSNNRAIILLDEGDNENPNGGTGKGLFCAAISKIKNYASIDGKTFNPEKSFSYQTVSTSTQIMAFDDVSKDFDFERLFSLITEGITLEYKNKQAIKLSVQESPKIVISSNYTIRGEGGSHDRRKFEIELKNYFSSNYTPIDEFKHNFFDDWDIDEWLRFDNYMIDCLQYYLNNGLISYNHINLKTRKYKSNVSEYFLNWIETNPITFNERFKLEDLKNTYAKNSGSPIHFVPKTSTFANWVKAWCEHEGYNIERGNGGMGIIGSWWLISNKNTLKDYDDAPF